MEELELIEVEIREFAERGEEVPRAKSYHVHIDGEKVTLHEQFPTGEMLLNKVDKKPCAFELIEELVKHESEVVEPHEKVDLRKHGLRGFITAHKEIVTIFIKDKPYQIERGERTVDEILAKVGQTSAGYVLYEEKNGPPMPLRADAQVHIHGCEIFTSQVPSGGSSHPQIP